MNICNVILILVVAFSSLKAQNITSRKIDIGGYSLNFNSSGKGNHTIIIEAGGGSWSLLWNHFQQELSTHAKVITYDRAGYGESDASPFSRTIEQIAEELHTALVNAGEKGPFILMGHSYGGWIVKTFAKKYPADVKALILAESATEGQFSVFPPIVKKATEIFTEQLKHKSVLLRTGKLDLKSIQLDSSLSADLWPKYIQAKTRAEQYEANYNENYLMLIKDDYGTIVKPLAIPTLIITAEKSFNAFKGIPNFPIEECNVIWGQMQSKLKDISTNSQQVIIKNSTHDLKGSAESETIVAIVDLIKRLNN